jgi:hypothetical protein
VPWKHEEVSASLTAATTFIEPQAGKTRPGAHNPGDPERYRGLPPLSRSRPQVLFPPADCKPAVVKQGRKPTSGALPPAHTISLFSSVVKQHHSGLLIRNSWGGTMRRSHFH